MPKTVQTGLEIIGQRWPKHLEKARIGLLVHPSSVDSRLNHAVDLFLKHKTFTLKALFGPQHGIRGETQDNMIEWEGFRDSRTRLPVHSLYGTTRKPTPEMLRPVDAMIVDLQDIGARYYTFIWTLFLVMEACRENGKAVVILDRPNPITGAMSEGPVLEEGYSSFVGLRPLPIRHGMTVGEIGSYLCQRFLAGLDLTVIRMKGWQRTMWFDQTGLPWVFPSPNMPTLETAIVYPGMCLLEGTNLSEGRGTTRPFEIFGAPFVDPVRLTSRLSEFRLPGVFFRPLHFLPTFQKHAGTLCGGAQVHITDRQKYRSFKTAVAVLKAAHDLWPKQFAWKQPPYEYETKKMPIDILAGSQRIRKEIDQGVSLNRMEEWWQAECRSFSRVSGRTFLLYP